MATTHLFEPLLDSGIRWVHYFNGRLVSAEDQFAEQFANGQEHRRLGQAIGAGVVHGLDVVESSSSTAAQPVLTVTRGLALSRSGAALALSADTTVALVRPQGAQGDSAAGFGECSPVTPGVYLTGAGIYLLTIAPAEGTEGRAPVSGLGNLPAPCNVRYRVETVQFRLLEVPHTTFGLQHTDLASERLRNRIAYACFGTRDLGSEALRPPATGYGALDTLRGSGRLSACEVPLALLYWTLDGLQFVDRWAVRRRTTADAWPVREAPETAILPARWSLLLGDRRLSEAEAMFLQFAEQITPAQVAAPAARHFAYLPAAGFLPLGGVSSAWQTFLQGMQPAGPTVGDLAFLRWLIHDSLYVEPIDVSNPPPIQVYAFPEIGDAVLYVRAERRVAVPGTPPPVTTPSPEPGVFVVSVRDEAGRPVPAADIGRVWAEAVPGGKQFSGEPIEGGIKGFFGSTVVEQFGTPTRYQIRNVPAGSYLIKAEPRIAGKVASRATFWVGAVAAEMLAGREVAVSLTLYERVIAEPWREPLPTKPWIILDELEFLDRFGNRYDKLVLLDPALLAEKVPWVDPGYIDPVPELRAGLTNGLRNWLLANPELPLTSEDPRIAVQPGYQPGVVTTEPYAYVVTGGAAIPAILVPSERALPGSVPVSRSSVPELSDPLQASRLDRMGLGDLDVLASAWGGLVAGGTSFAMTDAQELIADAGGQIPEVRATLGHYPGLDRAAGVQLRDSGIDDVGLANASVEQIRTIIGADYSVAFVTRLIDRARALTGESAWSLEAGRLGLTADQVDLLHGAGIHTRGQLAQAIEANALSADVLSALGWQDQPARDGVKAMIDTDLATARVRLMPQASLSSVPGLTPAMSASLVDAGLTSPASVAAAPAETLAETLHVSVAEAQEIVRDALVTTLTRTSGVNREEAVAIVTATNATSLDTLAGVDVRTVAIPAGMSPERFAGVIERSRVMGRLVR
jgi:hypothetical protein